MSLNENDTPESTPGVEQSVLDHIDSVFNTAGDETLAPETDAPRNPTALKQEARQQAEELEQEEAAKLPKPAVKPTDVEADPEEEDAVEPAETAAPAITDDQRDIAKFFGFTDEKLDKLAAKDPELLNDTLSQLTTAYANLSRSSLSAAPANEPAPQQVAPAQQVGEVPSLDALYNNLKSFAEANGEEIVDKFLKPLQKEIIEPVRQMMAQLQVQQKQHIATEATGAFEKLSARSADHYGKGTTLTETQRQARHQVAQLADQLRTGAKMQGLDLSVSDAIHRAHLVLSADRQKAEVRAEIKGQVQKRAKAVTQRPTGKSAQSNPLPSRTDRGAMEAMSRRAIELGIELD
jgi:uncharacterized phage infection (PIP) family protein YhgE